MNQHSVNQELFKWKGNPPAGASISLAMQHLVAMIVGCVTPAIIIANVIGLSSDDRIILIQACLVMSAVSTFIQLFPIGGKIGSALPVILGTSFAYLPSMQAIAEETGGIAAITGAMVVGGVVAVVFGIFSEKIRKFFPAIITGTVVFTIGLSLYPTAINYMAGGTSNTADLIAKKGLNTALIYGSWQNWTIAIATLVAVMLFNNYGKGVFKLASILLGMIVGYIIAAVCGMVDFSSVGTAAWFSVPQPLHFGITFEPSACIALGILFAINSVQAIGDFTSTTVGGFQP
jgi:xanthine/uracil permease